MKKKRIQRPVREYTDYQREYRRIYRTLNNGAPIYDSSDYVSCLICFKLYIRVCTHVVQIHSITTAEYKKRFGLGKKSLATGKFNQLNYEWNKRIGFAKSTEYAKAMSKKGVAKILENKRIREEAKLPIAK